MENERDDGRKNGKKPKLVGRRKLPPEDKRWKKGISGNPRGRPKKEDCLTDELRQLSAEICAADPKRRTWGKLLAYATMQLAVKGHPVALRETWERLEGKVPQPEQHSFASDGPVEINVVYGDHKESGEDQDKDEDGE
jgi:hypothetical protein